MNMDPLTFAAGTALVFLAWKVFGQRTESNRENTVEPEAAIHG